MAETRPKLDFIDEEYSAMLNEQFGGPMSLMWLSSVSGQMCKLVSMQMQMIDAGDERFCDPFDRETWAPLYDDEMTWAWSMMADMERLTLGATTHSDRHRELIDEIFEMVRNVQPGKVTEADVEKVKAIGAESMGCFAAIMAAYRDWSIRMDTQGPTRAELERMKASTDRATMQFQMRVMLPCLICYGASPQQLLRKAREGDADAVEKLVTLDKGIVSDKGISERLHQEGLKANSAYVKAITREKKKGREQSCSARGLQLILIETQSRLALWGRIGHDGGHGRVGPQNS